MDQPIKAGDKLAMTTRYGFIGLIRRRVVVVERVTPTGIIKVGGFQLNPDLSLRGREREYSRVAFERCCDTMEQTIDRENRDKDERIQLIKENEKDWRIR